MHASRSFPLVALAIALLLPSFALLSQETEEAASSSRSIPADLNGHRTLIAAPKAALPIRVAIFEGPGVGGSGVENVTKAVATMPGSTIEVLGPEAVGSADLKAFDVIVFPGGSGSKQSAAIGEAGKENVLRFVREGGGYVGICAGAYLACSGFSWGLGVINAKTVSSKWRRGTDNVDGEMSASARALFGDVGGVFKIRYNNGPIIQPDPESDLPAYLPVMLFRSEVAENDSPAGVMVNSPAAATATYGAGRVFISSPHPEATPGLEHLIPRALLWAAGQAPETLVPTPPRS